MDLDRRGEISDERLARIDIAGLVGRLRDAARDFKGADPIAEACDEAANALEGAHQELGRQAFFREQDRKELTAAKAKWEAAEEMLRESDKLTATWEDIETAPREIDCTIVVAYKAGPHWIKRLAFWHPENGWTDVMAGTIYRNVEWWRPLFDDPPLAAQDYAQIRDDIIARYPKTLARLAGEEDGSNDDRASNLHSRSGDVHIPTYSVTQEEPDFAYMNEAAREIEAEEIARAQLREGNAAARAEAKRQGVTLHPKLTPDIAGLVERLRKWGVEAKRRDTLLLINEAADALERTQHLYAQTRAFLGVAQDELTATKAVIERLRDEKATVTRLMNERNYTVIDLRAENERLRNALGKEQR